MSSNSGAIVRKRGFLLRYALRSFAIVFLLAFLIRAFLFSSYAMSSSSMLPSVWPGDFIVAGRIMPKKLARGQVVVLRCPGYRERVCLKRVVGLAGDRVELHEGKLILNGREAVYRPLGPEFQTEEAEGQRWGIWPSAVANVEALVVPPDSVYLLNDRRSDTDDSRTWGPLSVASIDAKAIRVWISLDWYDGDQIRSWPRVRWARLLRSID